MTSFVKKTREKDVVGIVGFDLIGLLPRLDFRRLPGPVFDPHFPEQRLVIEPIYFPPITL